MWTAACLERSALGQLGGVRLLYLPLLEEPPDVATGPVLKTGEVQALGGSTPSSSAPARHPSWDGTGLVHPVWSVRLRRLALTVHQFGAPTEGTGAGRTRPRRGG